MQGGPRNAMGGTSTAETTRQPTAARVHSGSPQTRPPTTSPAVEVGRTASQVNLRSEKWREVRMMPLAPMSPIACAARDFVYCLTITLVRRGRKTSVKHLQTCCRQIRVLQRATLLHNREKAVTNDVPEVRASCRGQMPQPGGLVSIN